MATEQEATGQEATGQEANDWESGSLFVNERDFANENMPTINVDGKIEHANTMVSETVFVADEWGIRKGKDLKRGKLKITKKVKKQEPDEEPNEEPNEEADEDEDEQNKPEDWKAVKEITAAHLTDCFNAAFEPDLVTAPNSSSTAKAYFEQLVQTAEFQKTRESTVLDSMLSEMIANIYARGLRETLVAVEQEQKAQEQAQANGLRRKPKSQEQIAMGMAAKTSKTAANQAQSQQDINDALGLGGGNQEGNISRGKLQKIHEKVRNNKALKAICMLAGRYRRAAQSQQRKKTKHGVDEVVGIEYSGDLSKLLPSALAMLNDEDFDDEELRKFAERQCLSRQISASEPVAKGPIVVSIDESGSMDGEPLYHAKAMALSMAQIASKQKRWCVLESWSDSDKRRSVVLKPGNWPTQEIVNWLCKSFDCGTHPPVLEWPQSFEKWNAPKGKTDIVCITDALWPDLGQGEYSEEITHEQAKQRFLRWKQEAKVRLIGITIGEVESNSKCSLVAIADEHFPMKKMGIEEEGVLEAFSV